MKLKRVFSWLLACVMMMTMLPAAGAASFGDTRGHWAARVIGKWSDYGVIQVHNGNFNPDNPIARGDIAVVIDKHLDYQTEAENTFTDLGQLALSRSAVRSVALELFYIVQEYFERNDLPAARLLPRSYRTYEQLLHMETLREVTGWMGMLRDDLAAFLRRESEKGYPKIVGTVLDWVAAHYRESASLQEAARVAVLNPSYLSALLKKYTGKSYIKLLAEYRIERAKELLVRTGEKVYRVGQMVGYEDKYYFGRVFKRVTGMSPGEFKNQKREG